MDEENVVYTMKYHSDLIRKETLPYVITWMNLEDIMLNETSQLQKSQKQKPKHKPA